MQQLRFAIQSLPWNARLRESQRHSMEEFMLETLSAKVVPGVEHIQAVAIICSYRCRENKREIPV